MELFLENEKLDVTSLRFEGKDLILEKDGEEIRHPSETGWSLSTGVELRATRRPREKFAEK